MTKSLSKLPIAVLALAFVMGVGCDKKEPTSSKTTSTKSASPTFGKLTSRTETKSASPTFGKLTSRTEKGLNGTIRIADQSLRVTPFVSHDQHSDLKTNCLKAYDDAKKNGNDNPILCYDKKPRTKVSTLRIETYTPKGFEQARANMAKSSEGTHFMIRSSGSIYQMLDLAYAVRRDGELRPNEVRVLSAFPAKEEVLFKELKTYLPRIKLEKHGHVSDSK